MTLLLLINLEGIGCLNAILLLIVSHGGERIHLLITKESPKLKTTYISVLVYVPSLDFFLKFSLHNKWPLEV